MRTVNCEPVAPGTAPWRSALAALESALPEFGERRADVVVILSNHFVRYATVANSDQIGTAEEEQALARHSFAHVYGAAVDHWVLSVTDTNGGAPCRIAAAIDQDLHQALHSVFAATRLRLSSIQPYLMSASHRWRRLIASSAWLALVEPGRMCLVRIQHRQWQSVKTVAIGDDWFGDLAVQLDRELLLSGPLETETGDPTPVLVFAPGLRDPDPVQAETRAMRLLRTSPPATDAGIPDAAYAMAGLG